MLLTSALLSCKIASYLTFSFNLHVLGLPPAFVLSQDQTLILIDVFHPVCFLLHFKRISWFLFRNITDFIFYIPKIHRLRIPSLLIHSFFITLRFLSTTNLQNLSSTSYRPVSRFIEQQLLSVNKKNQKKSFFLHFYFNPLFLLPFLYDFFLTLFIHYIIRGRICHKLYQKSRNLFPIF